MVPNFKINTAKGPEPDNMIIDLNGFYIHMMHFILYAKTLHPEENSLWNSENILCRFIDEDKNIYTSTLEEDGYELSLKRCLTYFEKIEEFEKCTLIKSMLK
jgi:hypothetical protein